MATDAKLDAIILAAGLGARFGGGKLTASYGAGLLIDGALAAAKAAPVRDVYMVTGADPKVVAAARGAMIVHAPDFANGLSASLRAGIAALPEDSEGVFIFLGDMPRIPRGVLRMLANALEGHDAAAPVFEGQRGHPVLIARTLFAKLKTLTGDQGAGAVLAALGERLALVKAPDDGVLFDVDTRSA